jgi:hypothetical protein
LAALIADGLSQGLQTIEVTRPARHAYNHALGSKGARDGAAKTIASPDNQTNFRALFRHACFFLGQTIIVSP